MQGISSKALGFGEPSNKRKFNGGNELQSKEFSDGTGLEIFDAVNRIYDPQIGRFWQIDELAEANWEWTPYEFAHNNPILFNDPLGLDPEGPDNVKTLPEVEVVAIPKGFWAKQNMYYDVMHLLSHRGATIDNIAQPSLREMMYRFDDITNLRSRIAEMTYQSDPIIWGIFFAPIALVEGGLILTESQLSSLLADAPYILKYLSNKKYNQAIRTVLNYLAKRMPAQNIKDFERLGRILKEMKNYRDLQNDLKTLKEVKDLIEKIFKLKL